LGIPTQYLERTMSETDVELAREFTAAFNAHDVEALVACCHPDVEFHSTFAAVGGAVYQGHDGMRAWFRDLADAWGDELRSELEAFFDLGEDKLLTFYVLHARGRQSGVEVTLPVASVARTRGGLFVYFKAYAHRGDALEELGISEDALEPIAP
jgi:ketosteroid isomerase-like protein